MSLGGVLVVLSLLMSHLAAAQSSWPTVQLLEYSTTTQEVPAEADQYGQCVKDINGSTLIPTGVCISPLALGQGDVPSTVLSVVQEQFCATLEIGPPASDTQGGCVEGSHPLHPVVLGECMNFHSEGKNSSWIVRALDSNPATFDVRFGCDDYCGHCLWTTLKEEEAPGNAGCFSVLPGEDGINLRIFGMHRCDTLRLRECISSLPSRKVLIPLDECVNNGTFSVVKEVTETPVPTNNRPNDTDGGDSSPRAPQRGRPYAIVIVFVCLAFGIPGIIAAVRHWKGRRQTPFQLVTTGQRRAVPSPGPEDDDIEFGNQPHPALDREQMNMKVE
jgi:hypothetical protein